MPQIALSFGILFVLAGLVWLVRSTCGRRISTPPYCRKCKYDLSGLDLSAVGHCPECGRSIGEGTRSVCLYRRRFRVWLFVGSLVMLSVGSTGIGFPKIMGMPAFDRVDLYSGRSEISLMVFERVGDERAEMILYQKLMRGELSDRGVDRLTKLAIKEYQTEQAGYLYSRWHHVMSLAMLEHRLSDEQLHAFIEHQVNAELEIRTQIHPDDPEVFVIVRIDEPGFVSRTNFAQVPWRKRQGMPIDVRFESPFSFENTVSSEVLFPGGIERQELGKVTPAMWAFRHEPIKAGIAVPAGQSTIEIAIEYKFKVMEGDTLVHAWTHRELATVQRPQADDFVYAQPIDDLLVIENMISRLSLHAVKVSTKCEEARQFDGTNGNESAQPLIRLQSYKVFDHTILGDIQIRIGDTEIPYEPIVWKTVPHQPSPKGLAVDYNGWGWAGPGDFDQVLDYLDEHAEFWAMALEVGKVDVLIVPNAELARENPGVESFVNRTIIFRDVPIHGLEPMYRSGIGSNGEPYDIMRWQPIGGHEQFNAKPRTQPAMAEILESE